MKCTEPQLRELIAQWRECVRIEDEFVRTTPRTETSVAYLECIEDLEAIMSGDLAPIAKLENPLEGESPAYVGYFKDSPSLPVPSLPKEKR